MATCYRTKTIREPYECNLPVVISPVGGSSSSSVIDSDLNPFGDHPDRDWWIKNHPPKEPENNDPGPNDKYLNWIRFNHGQGVRGLAEVVTATKAAMKEINESISDLREALSKCGTGDHVEIGNLLDCLEAEGNNPNYADITIQDLKNFPDANGRLFGATSYNPNHIYIDYDYIVKKFKDNPPFIRGVNGFNPDYEKFNPLHLSIEDFLASVLLHEMIHNCTNDTGIDAGGSFPKVTEIDALVIAKMMGGNILEGVSQANFENQIDTQGAPKSSDGWFEGNYFDWDEATGKVRCKDGQSLDVTLPKGG